MNGVVQFRDSIPARSLFASCFRFDALKLIVNVRVSKGANCVNTNFDQQLFCFMVTFFAIKTVSKRDFCVTVTPACIINTCNVRIILLKHAN